MKYHLLAATRYVRNCLCAKRAMCAYEHIAMLPPAPLTKRPASSRMSVFVNTPTAQRELPARTVKAHPNRTGLIGFRQTKGDRTKLAAIAPAPFRAKLMSVNQVLREVSILSKVEKAMGNAWLKSTATNNVKQLTNPKNLAVGSSSSWSAYVSKEDRRSAGAVCGGGFSSLSLFFFLFSFFSLFSLFSFFFSFFLADSDGEVTRVSGTGVGLAAAGAT
mmetsp:Transcript_44055/g.86143  ORF Transcript_44055/g.86143 Transcript_44055/m.86143 type:complete len:218 (-) Transcript_44055:385-1038(-)